jgi:hypothetical protein
MGRRISEIVGTLSDTLNIGVLLGVPFGAISSFGTAIWAHLERLRFSYVFMLSFAVFALALWSWIGLIWLFDRARASARPSSQPLLDCAWGLIIDGAFITFDQPGAGLGCQISISIRNRLAWPLKCQVVSKSVETNHVIPDIAVEGDDVCIVMPEKPMNLNVNAYSHGKIAVPGKIGGKIDVTMNYGHPDGGYSRTMSRSYKFEITIGVTPALPPFAATSDMPPVVGRFSVMLSPLKQDIDAPFV